jgi:hypothetical protein
MLCSATPAIKKQMAPVLAKFNPAMQQPRVPSSIVQLHLAAVILFSASG